MEKILLVMLTVACVSLALLSGFIISQPAEIVTKEVVVKELVYDNTTSVLLEELKTKIDSLEEFTNKNDEELQNETAKALVSTEMDRSSFLKDVKTLLEDNDIENKTIESYKDLEIYSIKVKSSEVEDEEAEVVVEFKVVGFEEDDDELEFKAKIIATFTVSELVIEDNFEDADIEYELELSRFYD